MKKCLYCAEEIQDGAVKCKHCGEWVNSSAPNDTSTGPSAQPPGITIEKARMLLRNPEVLPCAADRTMEFWLTRIGLWGELKITYINSATRTKERITKDRLLRLLTDQASISTNGRWDTKKLSVKSLEVSRSYRDSNRRRCNERILIDVDLKPELKRAIRGKF